ncbi:hypothetical protein [Actinoplanes derwentensis]|uniref:Uncharacterized protein n=1 Tax=Actinoplanes derwentensis TaxID=113562 RepID=A0A1H1XWR5_9ACTN|nr:hypothetical protein [Actinoplanes derwentensis]GID90126.1 hypothetical protein Ade03nite_90500 [Actinoplanes derwentensis]SDT13309.1 hypothetical protein SAMN04489716_2608 [Actinoplanes derwentensis]
MYQTPRPAYDLACDCNCPIHRGLPRSAYNAPGCRCLTSCASQPITVLAPQINGALFLDRADALWFVPALQPGHWDWRCATPVTDGHPLADADTLVSTLLAEVHARLVAFTHCL